MTRSERWSIANAGAMLSASAGALRLGAVKPLVIVGLGMLGFLVLAERGRWTPCGHVGLANGVTVVRIGLLGLLPLASGTGPDVLLGLSLVILTLDGVDGWVARRRGLSSEFGAFLDKETDALFLLLLCGLAAFGGRLPLWILGVGLLRYAFVILLFLLPSPQTKEARSPTARYAYGFMIGALLTAFFPYPALYWPLVLLATAALLASFAQSLWRIVPQQEALGES